MSHFVCIIALLVVSAFAQKTKTILYINGDYSSIDYHLGVLSEIERLQIPIDSVVVNGESALIGALWSAGWSPSQIGELVKSWEKLPYMRQKQISALLQKRWLLKNDINGSPILEDFSGETYFGEEFFKMQVQEAYWRSDIGTKIAFREIDSANSYPFPPPQFAINANVRIFSNPIALRDTSDVPAKRYQQTLWSMDSTLVMLRPHSKPNPDSLFKAGVQAVQTRRSIFAQLYESKNYNDISKQNANLESFVPQPPRFLYIPVFDSVPAERQMHLESFWNKKDTGSLAVKNFLENLQKDGYYQNVKLDLDTGSLLHINAESSPILSLYLQGIGGSLFGANVAAGLNLRFVEQFGYNINLNAIYGQGIKGFVPELTFERFFADYGNFFVKAKFLDLSPSSFFLKSQDEGTKILNEKANWVSLGIEKSLGINKPVLIAAVEIERKEITTDFSKQPIYEEGDYWLPGIDTADNRKPIGYEYYDVTASSMFPHVKWLWQSEGYDRWFAVDGFMAELVGGFKAVSVRSSDSEAPLYVSTQGKISITHPFSKFISLMSGAEFGANFRRNKLGNFVLPNGLYGKWYDDGHDPALENRYRFAMGMGEAQENWQSLVNASHLYGLLVSGMSLHLNGNGFFVAAGFAKDGEPNHWAWELGSKRFFVEPKIRIETEVFDFVVGQNIIYFSEGHFEKSVRKMFFLEFRGRL